MFEFLLGVKAELSKVIWPTWGETLRYTIAIILFSLAVAFVLGAADFVLIKVFSQILAN